MAVTETTVAESCAAAKRAARALATASAEAKNAALEATARLLGERSDAILEANAGDLADERAAGLTEALREFTALVREGMVEREEELRVTLGLDGTHDLVDYVPGHTGGLEPEVR
jgi:glutamate-5-semialdehyde dehydrogenase